jgi:hypothetical protein
MGRGLSREVRQDVDGVRVEGAFNGYFKDLKAIENREA